jgi:hypothetical protein
MEKERRFGNWWWAMPALALLLYFFVFPFLYYRPAYSLLEKGLIPESLFKAPLGPIAWLEERWPAYGKFLSSGVQFTFTLFEDPNQPPRID